MQGIFSRRLVGLTILGPFCLSANAANIELFAYGFNVDGAIALSGAPISENIDVSGFGLSTDGLGQINIAVTGAGTHNALVFLDHEIDEALNTYFNETASTGGTPLIGQSWEADEPGYAFGNIRANFLANALDNTNAFPPADDVAMAIGWDFTLAAGETAIASFFTSTINDSSGGFFIEQYDANSEASIFFWSTLTIAPVPVPGAVWLFASALGLLGWLRRSGA